MRVSRVWMSGLILLLSASLANSEGTLAQILNSGLTARRINLVFLSEGYLQEYAAEVGLFEGAHYHASGWYRPKLDCKMNHLGVPFCEVCCEAIVKSTYELVRPIDSHTPATNAVITLVDTQVVALAITRLQPVAYRVAAP